MAAIITSGTLPLGVLPETPDGSHTVSEPYGYQGVNAGDRNEPDVTRPEATIGLSLFRSALSMAAATTLRSFRIQTFVTLSPEIGRPKLRRRQSHALRDHSGIGDRGFVDGQGLEPLGQTIANRHEFSHFSPPNREYISNREQAAPFLAHWF